MIYDLGDELHSQADLAGVYVLGPYAKITSTIDISPLLEVSAGGPGDLFRVTVEVRWNQDTRYWPLGYEPPAVGFWERENVISEPVYVMVTGDHCWP